MSTVPSWLVGYIGPSASRPPQPQKRKAEREIPTGFGHEIDEPREWPFDGDLTRRVEVWDRNCTPPRLVRKCGYRKCLRCRKPFFSEDCTRIRMCGPCKVANTVDAGDGFDLRPRRKPRQKSAYGTINFTRRS